VLPRLYFSLKLPKIATKGPTGVYQEEALKFQRCREPDRLGLIPFIQEDLNSLRIKKEHVIKGGRPRIENRFMSTDSPMRFANSSAQGRGYGSVEIFVADPLNSQILSFGTPAKQISHGAIFGESVTFKGEIRFLENPMAIAEITQSSLLDNS